jgi:hypothetical protein
MDDQYGLVGMVDNLISDRYGWRVNLGWTGRKDDWMKPWPGFLDDILVNFDLAQKTEYASVADEQGYSDVEAYDLITPFYPEDTGLWGYSVWGGYNGPATAGQAYVNNIEQQRNDPNWNGTSTADSTYVVRFGGSSSERIPLILPVWGSNGQIETYTAANAPSGAWIGKNMYTNLTDLKTFNYATLTTKLQLNKMIGLERPFYAGLFYTDNGVSGTSNDPALSVMPDPNRPGHTLANIPDLFDQTAYDAAFMFQVAKGVNLLWDYGLELWKSQYTYPLVDYRTDSYGLGLAYDLPWGGGKMELRYKHLTFQDAYLPANDYQANQVYTYFLFQF